MVPPPRSEASAATERPKPLAYVPDPARWKLSLQAEACQAERNEDERVDLP